MSVPLNVDKCACNFRKETTSGKISSQYGCLWQDGILQSRNETALTAHDFSRLAQTANGYTTGQTAKVYVYTQLYTQ